MSKPNICVDCQPRVNDCDSCYESDCDCNLSGHTLKRPKSASRARGKKPMKDINPKTPIGTRLLSRCAPYAEKWDRMTAVLVNFNSGVSRPYEYVIGDGTFPWGDKRASINRNWRIADFSIVGFEGFGYEVTQLALKASWSVVKACGAWAFNLPGVIASNDAAMDWTRGPVCRGCGRPVGPAADLICDDCLIKETA